MQVEHEIVDPGPLAPYVVAIRGYRYAGLAPGTHIGMPSTNLTLIVSLDQPIVVSEPGTPPTAFDALIGGLSDRPATIHHDGSQHGVQVDLAPAAARALFGVPAGALQEAMPLDDVLPAAERGLAERVADAASLRARTQSVADALTRRLGATDAGRPRAEVAHAWAEIRRTRGRVAVRDVATDVGWSTRHLGEQFRAEYGVSPKTAARLTRFGRAHRLVRSGRALAAVAAECGYADQAHLNREFREYAGTSPTRWARDDEVAFVQDDR